MSTSTGKALFEYQLKLTGIMLKTLGIALLCFCLLEPQWVRENATPKANIIAILADNSQSMFIRDAGSSTSRAEESAKVLKSEPGDWQEALDENFQIRRYTFDTRRHWTDDFASLDFKGRASSLIGVTRKLGEDLSGQPLAGILLFTDGNDTESRRPGRSREQFRPAQTVACRLDEPPDEDHGEVDRNLAHVKGVARQRAPVRRPLPAQFLALRQFFRQARNRLMHVLAHISGPRRSGVA